MATFKHNLHIHASRSHESNLTVTLFSVILSLDNTQGNGTSSPNTSKVLLLLSNILNVFC